MPNKFLTIKEVCADILKITRQNAVESLPADATEEQIVERQAKIMYHMQGMLGGFPLETKL